MQKIVCDDCNEAETDGTRLFGSDLPAGWATVQRMLVPDPSGGDSRVVTSEGTVSDGKKRVKVKVRSRFLPAKGVAKAPAGPPAGTPSDVLHLCPVCAEHRLAELPFVASGFGIAC